jgi:hypothetical protein
MQWMMAAIGNAAAERRPGFDHHQTKWCIDSSEARNRNGGASEAAAHHADCEGCLAHFEQVFRLGHISESRHTRSLRR